MKKTSLIFIMILILFGCSEEDKAREAVKKSLNDPGSAKFGKFTKVEGGGACLTVNAKNRMGGYTGNQQAFLIKHKEWSVIDIRRISHDTCVKNEQSIIYKKKVDSLFAETCKALNESGDLEMWKATVGVCDRGEHLSYDDKERFIDVNKDSLKVKE